MVPCRSLFLLFVSYWSICWGFAPRPLIQQQQREQQRLWLRQAPGEEPPWLVSWDSNDRNEEQEAPLLSLNHKNGPKKKRQQLLMGGASLLNAVAISSIIAGDFLLLPDDAFAIMAPPKQPSSIVDRLSTQSDGLLDQSEPVNDIENTLEEGLAAAHKQGIQHAVSDGGIANAQYVENSNNNWDQEDDAWAQPAEERIEWVVGDDSTTTEHSVDDSYRYRRYQPQPGEWEGFEEFFDAWNQADWQLTTYDEQQNDSDDEWGQPCELGFFASDELVELETDHENIVYDESPWQQPYNEHHQQLEDSLIAGGSEYNTGADRSVYNDDSYLLQYAALSTQDAQMQEIDSLLQSDKALTAAVFEMLKQQSELRDSEIDIPVVDAAATNEVVNDAPIAPISNVDAMEEGPKVTVTESTLATDPEPSTSNQQSVTAVAEASSNLPENPATANSNVSPAQSAPDGMDAVANSDATVSDSPNGDPIQASTAPVSTQSGQVENAALSNPAESTESRPVVAAENVVVEAETPASQAPSPSTQVVVPESRKEEASMAVESKGNNPNAPEQIEMTPQSNIVVDFPTHAPIASTDTAEESVATENPADPIASPAEKKNAAAAVADTIASMQTESPSQNIALPAVSVDATASPQQPRIPSPASGSQEHQGGTSTMNPTPGPVPTENTETTPELAGQATEAGSKIVESVSEIAKQSIQEGLDAAKTVQPPSEEEIRIVLESLQKTSDSARKSLASLMETLTRASDIATRTTTDTMDALGRASELASRMTAETMESLNKAAENAKQSQDGTQPQDVQDSTSAVGSRIESDNTAASNPTGTASQPFSGAYASGYPVSNTQAPHKAAEGGSNNAAASTSTATPSSSSPNTKTPGFANSVDTGSKIMERLPLPDLSQGMRDSLKAIKSVEFNAPSEEDIKAMLESLKQTSKTAQEALKNTKQSLDKAAVVASQTASETTEMLQKASEIAIQSTSDTMESLNEASKIAEKSFESFKEDWQPDSLTQRYEESLSAIKSIHVAIPTQEEIVDRLANIDVSEVAAQTKEAILKTARELPERLQNEVQKESFPVTFFVSAIVLRNAVLGLSITARASPPLKSARNKEFPNYYFITAPSCEGQPQTKSSEEKATKQTFGNAEKPSPPAFLKPTVKPPPKRPPGSTTNAASNPTKVDGPPASDHSRPFQPTPPTQPALPNRIQDLLGEPATPNGSTPSKSNQHPPFVQSRNRSHQKTNSGKPNISGTAMTHQGPKQDRKNAPDNGPFAQKTNGLAPNPSRESKKELREKNSKRDDEKSDPPSPQTKPRMDKRAFRMISKINTPPPNGSRTDSADTD